MDEPDFDQLQGRLLAVARRLADYRWRFERQKDSRCVFTYAYELITLRIAGDLPTAGYARPAWVVELAEAFVTLYVEALDAWSARRSVSPGWDAVFEAMARKRSSVLEDLIFSMGVHIVHDLPLALRKVGMGGVTGSHVHDFHAVNTAMGEEIEPIKRSIARRYAPYIAWLDRIGRREEDLLTNYGVRVSRGLAWYNAVRLADPRSEREALESIERGPRAFVEEVLAPRRYPLSVALRLGRLLVGFLRRWPKRDLPPPRIQSAA